MTQIRSLMLRQIALAQAVQGRWESLADKIVGRGWQLGGHDADGEREGGWRRRDGR
ncbi:hypothetical protein SCOCK_150059 [Actinacidiphila cocklensis]|uniref:Uncharacterized protein n=1 Tax=Actinacidiphila cocklensis TaxID=887465 RepID=A0A9W4E3J2_9ACTN|nr:hypothetical protein SCOCK_150059 [Actinacidiphila cocklensis]